MIREPPHNPVQLDIQINLPPYRHPSSTMGEQTEAARRAAARKAKILARGNTGLNKLAQTARGEEAEKLYGESESCRAFYKSADSY